MGVQGLVVREVETPDAVLAFVGPGGHVLEHGYELLMISRGLGGKPMRADHEEIAGNGVTE